MPDPNQANALQNASHDSDNSPKPNADPPFDWHRRAGPIFKYALAIGLLLVAVSLASRKPGLATAPQIAMLMATGLGIILGAFGSLVPIRIATKSITVVGVAGISIAFFQHIREDHVLKIRVHGDVEQYQMTLHGDTQYHGADSKNNRHHEFVLFGHDLKTDVLELIVVARSSADEEYPFSCIEANLIRPHLASGKILNWRFERDPPRIVETLNKHEIAALTCTKSDEQATAHQEPAFALNSLWPISSAYAQPAITEVDNSQSNLLVDLESASPQTRRNARISLAKAGETALPALINQLETDSLSYRARLGTLVAIAEMQRMERTDPDTLKAAMTDEAISTLTELASGPDVTTRIYASEIMFTAADARVVRKATDSLASAGDNGTYNLLLVIREGSRQGTPLTQRDLDTLSELQSPERPKISALVADIVAQYQTGDKVVD